MHIAARLRKLRRLDRAVSKASARDDADRAIETNLAFPPPRVNLAARGVLTSLTRKPVAADRPSCGVIDVRVDDR